MAKPDPERFRKWGQLAGIGPLLAASTFLGYFAGDYLDGKLGTGPWLMLVGVLLGVTGGFVELVRVLAQAGRDSGPKRKG